MTSPVIVPWILLLTIKLKNCHRESESTMTLERISERKEANGFRINEGVTHIIVIEV